MGLFASRMGPSQPIFRISYALSLVFLAFSFLSLVTARVFFKRGYRLLFCVVSMLAIRILPNLGCRLLIFRFFSAKIRILAKLGGSTIDFSSYL